MDKIEFEKRLCELGILFNDVSLRKMFDIYTLFLNGKSASEICEITNYHKTFVHRTLQKIKRMQ